jgi:hypothetical protein
MLDREGRSYERNPVNATAWKTPIIHPNNVESIFWKKIRQKFLP